LQIVVERAQIWRLKQHLPRGTKLRISDVKEMFLQKSGLTRLSWMEDPAN
jgi:hypothetical protein